MPVSVRPAREPRYRVADPYLRFWLRFIAPALPDIARATGVISPWHGCVTRGWSTGVAPWNRWSGPRWNASP